MARIFLSPLIVDIRAKQKDTVFSKWKGINYIRSRVVPANPQSTAQTEVRDALTHLVDAWPLLNAAVKLNLDYFTVGRNKSGFNQYVGTNVPILRAGNPPQLTEDNGYTKLTAWSGAAGGAGQVTLTFAPTPVPATKKLVLTIWNMITGVFISTQEFAAGVTSPQTLSSLPAGGTVGLIGFIALAVPTTGDVVGQSSQGPASVG